MFQKILWGILLCTVFVWPLSGEASGKDRSLEEGWLWQIFVYPPSEGWESDEGDSIRAALEMVAQEVNERHYGTQNHDIRFVYQAPMLREDLYSLGKPRVEEWKKEKSLVGALSFAPDSHNLELLQVYQEVKLPLILAYGEEISLRQEYGPPLEYIFALDLYSRFRVASFGHLAPLLTAPKTGIALFSDRLDPVLRRSSTYLGEVLSQQERIPIPLWSAGAMDRDMRPALLEAQHAGGSVLVNVMGLMEALDLWRTLRAMGNPFTLWHAGDLDPMLEMRHNIYAVSQQWRIDRDPTLRELRSKIWFALHQRPRHMPLMARAYALGTWFVWGLDNAPEVPGSLFAKTLEEARNIPFGEEILAINPRTHRPLGRVVTLLLSSGSGWDPIKEFRVRSAVFPE